MKSATQRTAKLKFTFFDRKKQTQSHKYNGHRRGWSNGQPGGACRCHVMVQGNSDSIKALPDGRLFDDGSLRIGLDQPVFSLLQLGFSIFTRTSLEINHVISLLWGLLCRFLVPYVLFGMSSMQIRPNCSMCNSRDLMSPFFSCFSLGTIQPSIRRG